MVNHRIALYVEGDGKSNSGCRQGFRRFLDAAGLRDSGVKVFASGPRYEAYQDFVRDLANRTSELALLLVDSEGPVKEGHTVWQHLQTGEGSWGTPTGADDQAFLMVQAMETWFLADIESMKRYFGKGFNENPFKKWPSLEAVDKDTVFDTLKQATSGCSKRYTKGSISFDLLGMIDPSKVRDASPHAKELLDKLAEVTRVKREQK